MALLTSNRTASVMALGDVTAYAVALADVLRRFPHDVVRQMRRIAANKACIVA